jgi:hypothetical protein
MTMLASEPKLLSRCMQHSDIVVHVAISGNFAALDSDDEHNSDGVHDAP